MKYIQTVCLILFSFLTHAQQTVDVSNTNYHVNTTRGSIFSKVLGMEKSYQVFLPESYHYSSEATYPVVYLIDGDYNAYYQTGIIESLSNVSEKIPELIVVGISDNGNEGYRKNCTLKSETNPNGNGEQFLKYIEQELKPEIEKKFKVSPYQLLMGHSLGGLFATNVMVHHPNSFSSYIAIDPSYWWDDYSIIANADSLFKDKKELESNFFVTLADTKQMGVHEFVGVLEKYIPDSKKWTFKYYENENHGSVGLISVKDGLLKIFEDWELKRAAFYELKTSTEVVDYYKNLSKKYNSKLRLPPNLLSNIIYFYFRSEKMDELAILEKEIIKNFPSSIDDYYAKLAGYMVEKKMFKEAKDVLSGSIRTNENAFKSQDAMSKLYFAQDDFKKAKEYAEKSVEIAKKLRARQWQINELESNVYKINSRLKN